MLGLGSFLVAIPGVVTSMFDRDSGPVTLTAVGLTCVLIGVLLWGFPIDPGLKR